MEIFKAKPVQFPKGELSRCVLALQQLLVNYDKSEMYSSWVQLSPNKRARLRTAMARVIQEHFLSDTFWHAVKADIVQADGTVQVNSHLYQYLRKTLFRGNGRALLVFLSSIKEKQ